VNRSIGGIPIVVLAGGGAIAAWYVYQRQRGRIQPARGILVSAFDQPGERSDLVRGVVTSLLGAILAVYLVRRLKPR
jgi:uncharacterized SAM-binding protein YcdF (DUF218 family)